MDFLDPPFLDSALFDARLASAVSQGLVDPGLAQRLRLVVRLERGQGREGPTARRQEPLSGQTLGRQLGLSRAAVHKHVEQLRSVGFAIESAAGVGYRLARPTDDLLAAEAVVPRVLRVSDPDGPWFIGLPYLYLASCESTNLVLRQAAAGHPSEDGQCGQGVDAPSSFGLGSRASYPGSPAAGMVVATDHQVGGRGRLGRRWSDQAGKALMFSVLLRPSLAPGQAHLISLAAGLAVAQVLEALPGLAGRVSVKWPNDVLIDERKVCGILVAGSMDVDRLHWVVVGVGVNVNGDSDSLSRAINEQGDEGADVRPQPVSLEEASGAVVPRAALFACLLARLTDLFRSLDTGTAGAEELLLGLRTRDALKGRTVEVFGGSDMRHVMARGTAAGIGSEGQLLVRTAGGEVVSVVAGDVSLRRVTE